MGIAKKKNPLSQDNVRYKTRLVLKGYTQNEGVDYLRALAKSRSIWLGFCMLMLLGVWCILWYVQDLTSHTPSGW